MDGDPLDFTLSGAARAPALVSTPNLLRPKEPFHVQRIPPNAAPNSSPVYVTHLLSLSTSFGVPTLLAIGDDSSLTLIDKTDGRVVQSTRAFRDGSRITQAKPLLSLSTSGSGSGSVAASGSAAASASGSGSGSSSGSFVGSVSNGTVASWDSRTTLETPVWSLRNPAATSSTRAYLSVEPSPVDPHQLVAGTEQYGHGDADVECWDVRMPSAPVWSYNEVHSDDVTSLWFHPDTAAHTSILLSASTDGLVSAIDTTIQDEDDAVIAVGNSGNSIAKAGWISPRFPITPSPSAPGKDEAVDQDLNIKESDPRRKNLGTVWALGDMQTLTLFHADQFDVLLPTTDVRSSTSLRPPWSSDYIIDILSSPSTSSTSSFSSTTSASASRSGSRDSLTLLVGKSEGAFATLDIESAAAQHWHLSSLFPQAGDGTMYGHSDIVRSALYDPDLNTLYTGGEDGQLGFWSLDPTSPAAAAAAAAEGSDPLIAASTNMHLHQQSSSRVGSNLPTGINTSNSNSNSRSTSSSIRSSQRYTPYK
ncbi:hypothetical protein BCV70DRAFT_198976 [Testicularia cyperi]|uniref:Uncharacterized protein n=1 Tax=Testicularia cyperi TaxID=1882483 RepID=A0A317XTD7_9BASI|nr:hypothetical protein BCV70DRAFT_198976 [Testicularia cyperi]